MIGGKQVINLQKDGCVIEGTVVHEYLHALGFDHEQNRPDRDNFITINYANIMDGDKLLKIEINFTDQV